jgi:solute carrier family 25 (peroxisomal adenine nucleotide transporter), member 17
MPHEEEEHPDTILSEVLSASLGGAISASVLFPLEVLKTRMQSSHSSSDKDGDEGRESSHGGMVEYAKRLYQKEGYKVYLNGIETSALQSSMEKAFYFFAYTALKRLHGGMKSLAGSRNPTAPMSAGTNLLLGCLAEWAHLPITMPIDCLSTAIQTTQKQNAVQLMLTILKEGNMYRGIQAYYVLCFKPALQYTVFEQVKAAVLKSRKNKTLTAAESFLLGMVARTVATVAVFPFVRAKVVMQSRKASGTAPPELTIQTILKEIYQSNGIAGLYHGLRPELTRGIFSAALMLMIKEQLNGGIKRILYGPVKK